MNTRRELLIALRALREKAEREAHSAVTKWMLFEALRITAEEL